MKKLTGLLGSGVLSLCLWFAGCNQPILTESSDCEANKSDYYVAAYIWPSCHDDSLAHVHLWADGEGEWEVIKKGNPRFEGHYQPRQPLWGYEHDDDPKVVERWIDQALKHGVNTFIYDWYWFMD